MSGRFERGPAIRGSSASLSSRLSSIRESPDYHLAGVAGAILAPIAAAVAGIPTDRLLTSLAGSFIGIYLVLGIGGAIHIILQRHRRPENAAGLLAYFAGLVSILLVPVLGLLVEAIGVGIAVATVFGATVTFGASLLITLLTILGIILQPISTIIVVTKIWVVLKAIVNGRISSDRATELIGSSYFFTLLGFLGLGMAGEMLELSEIGEIADIAELTDVEQAVAEMDGAGSGPMDSTYGSPSAVDGDPRVSHYVEGYYRDDGTWVAGHWKSKIG